MPQSGEKVNIPLTGVVILQRLRVCFQENTITVKRGFLRGRKPSERYREGAASPRPPKTYPNNLKRSQQLQILVAKLKVGQNSFRELFQGAGRPAEGSICTFQRKNRHSALSRGLHVIERSSIFFMAAAQSQKYHYCLLTPPP